MPAIALDAERLAQLRVFSRDELRQIAADVIVAVTAQLERLDAALVSGDLATAADAAHRGRNEALLIGARALCGAFTALEHASRYDDAAGAEEALRSARELWPDTRAAIERLFPVEDQVSAGEPE